MVTTIADMQARAEALERAGQVREAAAALDQLGMALVALDKLPQAADCWRRAIRLKPESPGMFNNLAGVLRMLDALDEAADCCRGALQLRPDFAEAENNLALVLREQHRVEESLEHSGRAIALKPEYVEARLDHGFTLLMLGRLAEGWSAYEWRWRRGGAGQMLLPFPRWNGEELAGRTILLHHEQGFGDTIQFIRYAPLVKARGGTVLAVCPRPLVSLLATCPGVDRVVAADEPLPAFDVWTPLLSLPGIFGTSLETVPSHDAYLAPDEDLVARWRGELSGLEGLKVGIAWRGSPAYPADRSRSIPLNQLAPLAAVPVVTLVSLQAGLGREELAGWQGSRPIVDLGERLGDFYNTAAVVRNLDLVISCDSAASHLAGAVGVPVWLALARVPDWRWMLERGDSPWYPRTRLFRQRVRGAWPEVFERMAAQLAAGAIWPKH